MQRPYRILATILFFSCSLFGQQRIYGSFDVPAFTEDFNEQKGSFPTVTTVENYYTVDDSTYFMNRNHPSQSFAVMANFPNELRSFHLTSRIKLGPSETGEQMVGLIFMSQRDSNSAYVFEFNRNKRYRIRRIYNGRVTMIGESVNGWIKSNALFGVNEYNTLEVKTIGGDYDFHINGSFVTSFYDNTFEYGSMGFFLGPMTKARAEFFHIYTTEPGVREAEKNRNRLQIEQLEKENEALRAELAHSPDARIVELQGVIQVLETQLVTTNRDNEALREEIEQYEELRFLVGNIDKDLLLTLSRDLRDEIRRNQALTNENIQLRDSIGILTNEYEQFKLNVLEKIVDGTYKVNGSGPIVPQGTENKATLSEPATELRKKELPTRKAKKRN